MNWPCSFEVCSSICNMMWKLLHPESRDFEINLALEFLPDCSISSKGWFIVIFG